MRPKNPFIIPLLLAAFTSAGAIAAPQSTLPIIDTTVSAQADTIREVVVTGTRNATDIRHIPMTVSVINNRQIADRYEQSVLPVLTEQVPGLFITSRSTMGYGLSTGAAGGISLRGIGGSPTTRLLVLINGQPQYMGLMGHPIADSYQDMMTEKVEVLRGPASVLYGSNAMGGVINIVTDPLKTDGTKTNLRTYYGSYNTFSVEGTSRIRKENFSTALSASYNRSDGHRENMDYDQYTAGLKLGYDFTDNWRISADGNFTHFNTSNPGTVDNPLNDNDASITRVTSSLALENSYERTSGVLRLYYNYGFHEINDGYAEGAAPKKYLYYSQDRMAGVSWYQSASFFEGNRITAGVDFQDFGGQAWNRFFANDSTVSLADKSENEIGAYVDFRQTIWKILTIDAGVRYDHHSRTGDEWIPQAGVSVSMPHNSQLKATFGKGFRNPTLRELYMFTPSNADLKPEHLNNYEIAFSQHLLKGALSYGVNLFYLTADNLIQTVMTDGRPLNVNTGAIENWGAEATISYRTGEHWNFNLNYSWVRMVNPTLASPEHKLYAGANYTNGRWSASTGLQYIAGLYTVLPSASTPAVKENYLLWNLRASMKLTSFMDIFIRGENLLGQTYETYLGFPMPGATVFGGLNFRL